MTRGNQRDIDRARALQRAAAGAAHSTLKDKDLHAAKLREKQAAADARPAGTTLQQLVAIYQDSSDDVRALSPRTRACVPSRVSCDASARALSRRRVGGLIAHPRRAQLEGLKHFTSRFETRFVELTSDVDARVSADAVRLVHTLLQHKMLADPEEAMSCVLPLMSSNRTGALSRSRTGVRPTSTHPTVSSRLHPLTPLTPHSTNDAA